MTKYILLSIVAVLVILGIYTYSNQDNENSIQKPTISKQKKELEETKTISLPVVKDTKTVLKKAIVILPKAESTDISSKAISTESNQEREVEEAEIGKGLTLESIENADVSDKEKERMLDDMVYHQGLEVTDAPSLTEEEILNIINEDLKSGLIQ